MEQLKGTIIIPTLNEEKQIAQTLRSVLHQNACKEIIIVDGGSKDQTKCEVDQFPGVHWLNCPNRGRAVQMNFGANQAQGDYLLFLHADTCLPSNALEAVTSLLQDENVMGGSFSLQFDEARRDLNLLAWLSQKNWSIATFGDQGIFVRRSVFAKLGGFQALPILEDYVFQLQLRRLGRFEKLPLSVMTSARRFQRVGVIRLMLINWLIISGYFLGVPLTQLKRLYPDKR